MANDAALPDGITTSVTDNTASATGVVAAPPAAIFDYIRQPGNHDTISGDESVKGVRTGPDSLDANSKFGMKMKQWGIRYPMTSRVKEFEENKLIAWAHVGGHRWRWQLEDLGDGTTRVTETFDMTTAKFPPALRRVGYPKGHEANVAKSVANVRSHFGG